MNILFLGDIFGNKAIDLLCKNLKKIITKNKIDFVVAQGENASGRKGLTPIDYQKLKDAGVNAITMGNHVWAKDSITEIIDDADIIRPYNVSSKYPGLGSKVFKIKGKTLRISQFMGIAFNKLNSPWKQNEADNFFDAFDKLEKEVKEDYHIIDFHAETTSEKNVFGLYVDGKVNAIVGTHTHVQTNDERTLPNGTAYITDLGMVGPINSAIGASYETVYRKMRFDESIKFETSENKIILHGAILHINKSENKISKIKKPLR